MRFLIPAGRSCWSYGSHDVCTCSRRRTVGVRYQRRDDRAERHPSSSSTSAQPRSCPTASAARSQFRAVGHDGCLEDCDLRPRCGVCVRRVRVSWFEYYSRLWEPVLSLGDRLRDAVALTELALHRRHHQSADAIGFEFIHHDGVRSAGSGSAPSSTATSARCPHMRHFKHSYVVARPVGGCEASPVARSDPLRNERGNIENAVRRLGLRRRSRDLWSSSQKRDPYEECLRVRDVYPQRDIRVRRPAKSAPSRRHRDDPRRR